MLRDTLDLTGTKEGCSIGVGACSVIVDGRLSNSCPDAGGACQGEKIETIEGLAKDGKLHPLQQAFIGSGGFECGICTPPHHHRTAKALLDENPKPSEDEVKEWMSGNLCRCTGYYKILESVMAVVNGKTDPDYGFRKRETTAKIQSLNILTHPWNRRGFFPQRRQTLSKKPEPVQFLCELCAFAIEYAEPDKRATNVNRDLRNDDASSR